MNAPFCVADLTHSACIRSTHCSRVTPITARPETLTPPTAVPARQRKLSFKTLSHTLSYFNNINTNTLFNIGCLFYKHEISNGDSYFVCRFLADNDLERDFYFVRKFLSASRFRCLLSDISSKHRATHANINRVNITK